MKKILFLFVTFSIFIRFPLFSQDIIIKNNKVEIKAKVVEIQEDLIKYKQFEDPTGPLRNIQIPDVFMIIYETGKRETFASLNKELNANSVSSTNSTDKSTQATAKIEKPIIKGNITLGGDIYFGHYNYDSKQVDPVIGSIYESSQTSFSISPSFGYFIFNGFVIGLSPSFSYTSEKISPGDYFGETYEIGLAPYVKYYFKNHIFIGLESGYSYIKFKHNNILIGDLNRTYNKFTISPSIGYAIFINPKVSIEPSLNYLYSKQSTKLTESVYEDIRKNFTFSAGFHIFL